jgi:hypothetical protein
MFKIQSLHARCCKYERVKIFGFEFFKTRIQIPADGLDNDIRSGMPQLGAAPQAAGADNAARRHFRESGSGAGDEYIHRIFAFGDRTDAQSRWNVSGHILHAVHCYINASGQQCIFNFFYKKAFAAHFGKGDIQNFVPLSFYDRQFNGSRREFFFKKGFGPVGLPQRQFTAAGSDSDGIVHLTQWLQPAQLDAAQPLQADAPAELDTVSPPLPFEINPQGDISLDTFLLLQEGQPGFSLPKTRYSKSWSQFLQ